MPFEWNDAATQLESQSLPRTMDHFFYSDPKRQKQHPTGLPCPVIYYPYTPYRLDERKVDLPVLEQVFFTLRSEMIQAHKMNIYHLDINVGNVLSSDRKKWKFSDLEGLYYVDPKQSVSVIPSYLGQSHPPPPERHSGKTRWTSNNLLALSIWQLGILFFQLLTESTFTLEELGGGDGAQIKEKTQIDPFAFLCPEWNESRGLTLTQFQEQFHRGSTAKMANLISRCLLVNPTERRRAFLR
jgi:serine/threonine protein kinase